MGGNLGGLALKFHQLYYMLFFTLLSVQFLMNFLYFSKDVQIGQRMITISTVGVPNTIKRLASHKLQSTLAVR